MDPKEKKNKTEKETMEEVRPYSRGRKMSELSMKMMSFDTMDLERSESLRKIKSQLSIASSHLSSPEQISARRYQEWFDILVRDDARTAEILLNTITKEERELLLTSDFDFEDTEGFGIQEENMEKVTLPFHVAIGCCSRKVAEVMLTFGADVLARNNAGNNILHSCVITAFNRPETEEDLCETIKWLLKQVNSDTIPKLLFTENDAGLRPVEFAAQQGCLKIMMTLFYTRGHISDENVLGLGTYRLHDITEYETGERCQVSPLHMLTFLDMKKLQDPSTSEVILGPFISGWINKKVHCNLPLIALWGLSRFVFIFLYIVLDLDIGWLEKINGNRSTDLICPELAYVNMGPEGNLVLSIILIAYCSAMTCIYVFETIHYRKLYFKTRTRNLNGRKSLISNMVFYGLVHALLVIVIMFACVQSMDLVVTNFQFNNVSFLLTDIARSFIPVLCLWSICFFLQLSPTIGASIISIQGMLIDLARFMLLFVIVMIPFVHVFEQFTLANSIKGCVQEFSSPYMTSYTLFRTMLNIFDPSGMEVNNIGVLYVLHVLFTFMVGVLLINFLIAMMSKKAAEIADGERVITKINQLALITMLEDRLLLSSRIGLWLFRKLRKHAFYCEEDKVFLKSVSCRFTEMYKEKQKAKNMANNSTDL